VAVAAIWTDRSVRTLQRLSYPFAVPTLRVSLPVLSESVVVQGMHYDNVAGALFVALGDGVSGAVCRVDNDGTVSSLLHPALGGLVGVVSDGVTLYAVAGRGRRVVTLPLDVSRVSGTVPTDWPYASAGAQSVILSGGTLIWKDVPNNTIAVVGAANGSVRFPIVAAPADDLKDTTRHDIVTTTRLEDEDHGKPLTPQATDPDPPGIKITISMSWLLA